MLDASPLASLPEPGSRRIAVRVTPDAERQIRGGHPWVYDRSIRSVGSDGAPGDLAVVFDRSRAFLAVGLYDPTSPIRVRILHKGRPTTIDEAWFGAALDAALDRRAGAFPAVDAGGTVRTDAYRIVHGENDGLGGLVIDRYGDHLVVEVFTAAWLPHLRVIVEVLRERLDARRVVVRLARLVQRQATHGLFDGQIVAGEDAGAMAETVAFQENGFRFTADLGRGQKTGHFCDQRDNRAAIGDHSAGATVLDVFSCTGGFSVHAAGGGAVSVTSVDRSEHALASARTHMVLNADAGTADTEHRTIAGDAFDVMDSLAQQGRTYDVVVVDPPSFARNADQVSPALEAYRRLAESSAALVRPGGLHLQASCSARIDADMLTDAVDAGLARRGRAPTERWHTGQPADHPVGFAQGAYLDAVWSVL
ncbi:MAG: class I SAM-dependent rRNA methyltransferase [Acidimicrobiales bacterium]